MRGINLNFWAVLTLIFVAALSRLLLFAVPNVSPITAMAIFGGAYLTDKKWAFGITLIAMWISDILLNNIIYSQYFNGFSWFGSIYVYVALALIIFLASVILKKISFSRVFMTSLSASVLFFLVTNFGSWLAPMNGYPFNFQGLILAYEAGLPFFRFTLFGDLIFVFALFGVYALIRGKIMQVKQVA